MARIMRNYAESRDGLPALECLDFDPVGISAGSHPKAIYTSRLLNFNNLPKPKILMIIINDMII